MDENHQFLWEGSFPVKMPTRCGNNRASPASEEFEKVKGSLKDVWETQGRANVSFQRQGWNFPPCQACSGDASSTAGSARK